MMHLSPRCQVLAPLAVLPTDLWSSGTWSPSILRIWNSSPKVSCRQLSKWDSLKSLWGCWYTSKTWMLGTVWIRYAQLFEFTLASWLHGARSCPFWCPLLSSNARQTVSFLCRWTISRGRGRSWWHFSCLWFHRATLYSLIAWAGQRSICGPWTAK